IRRHRASGFGLEDQRPYTDGVVTGRGTIAGRAVFVLAHDFRIFGGWLGVEHGKKILRNMLLAYTGRLPVRIRNSSAGRRVGEGGFVYDDETHGLEAVRYLISLLPSSNQELAPVVVGTDPGDRLNNRLRDLVPVDSARAYDIRAVIQEIVDNGDFFEVHEDWA